MIAKKKKVLLKMMLMMIDMRLVTVKKSIRVVIDPIITEDPTITPIIRLRVVVIIQIKKRKVVINVNDESKKPNLKQDTQNLNTKNIITNLMNSKNIVIMYLVLQDPLLKLIKIIKVIHQSKKLLIKLYLLSQKKY